MRTKYVGVDDVTAICANLTREEWLPLWVSLETGLRVGDVVALRSDSLCGEVLTFTASKTGKQGTAKLSPTLARDLSSRSGWLFPSPRDMRKHITRQAVWARVKRACKRAGLDPEGVAPHSFRKVFAVEKCRKDGIAATQEALQHDKASVTEIYALSDWLYHGDEPLLRSDITRIVDVVYDIVLAALHRRVSSHRSDDVSSRPNRAAKKAT